jgi:hypothetical protein
MKVGEQEKIGKPEPCEFKNPVALVMTYNRLGFLPGVVDTFFETTKGVPLHVFDDGSDNDVKRIELQGMEDLVTVHKQEHKGLVGAWREALEFARKNLCDHDSVILLEDDIRLGKGWLDVLKKMQAGIADLGYLQGMTSCFRPHKEPQSPVVDLKGVKAYQSMAHGFQVNLMPMAVLDRMDVFEEAAAEAVASKSGKGLDVYWVGNLAHRLNRVSFVSMQSWVVHIGLESMVGKQGYGQCRHPGFDLVPELRKFESIWKLY